jgi:hypothetical protein
MREAKSFTISSDLLAEIMRTKRGSSTSERVNELLRRGLDVEKQECLEKEVQEFFKTPDSANSTRERLAYQKAARRTLSRD